MASRKKKRARKKPASQQQEYPGWLWMVFGLAIGLSVAFAVYMRDQSSGVSPRTAATPEQPASMAAPVAGARQSPVDNNNEATAESESPEQRFTFYNMLPNFEVVIPEEEPEVEVDRQPQAVEQPGVYILQAGSFSSYEDADRRRAQLALHGIESRIQRVAIDDKTYHRVRIGPIDNLDELNVTRSRLRAANIDVLRIRLGD